MITRDRLTFFVINAIKFHGGEATIIEIAKHIWQNHEHDLRASGDLFFTWQYDFRWAISTLRKTGIIEHKRRDGRRAVIGFSQKTGASAGS